MAPEPQQPQTAAASDGNGLATEGARQWGTPQAIQATKKKKNRGVVFPKPIAPDAGAQGAPELDQQGEEGQPAKRQRVRGSVQLKDEDSAVSRAITM